MSPNFISELVSVPFDGLDVSYAELWNKGKVQLVKKYVTDFVLSHRDSVDEIILVDLYARNGFIGLGDKNQIYRGNALAVLAGDLPIDRYVLCESDPEQFKILKIRINKYHKDKNVILLNGHPHDLVEKIKMYVPQSKKNHKVAVICVADAFMLEPGLETLHQLGLQGFNFIIPVTFHLGNKPDYKFYLSNNKEKLKHFLGYISEADKSWKPENNLLFYKQLIQLWKSRLKDMGLKMSSVAYRLDSGLMELPSYQICMVSSRHATRMINMDPLSVSQIQFSLFNQN